MFSNCIKDFPDSVNQIRKYYKIEGRLDTALQSGSMNRKVDVSLGFTCGKNINVNIKAYSSHKGSMFNQATRTPISKFCEDFGIRKKDEEELWELVLAKSANANTPLIPQGKQGRWAAILQDRHEKIIRSSLSVSPNSEMLVLIDRGTGQINLYPMVEVLKQAKGEVSFTSRGNVMLGNFMVLQRKGGNGVHVPKTLKKTDRKHPGNHIQIKISIKSFFQAYKGATIDKIKL